MKFERGNKLRLTDITIDFEVEAGFPAAQGFTIKSEGDNYYRILMNGLPTYISESVLDEFIRASNRGVIQKQEVKQEIIEEDDSLPEGEEVVEEVVIKKKRGRKKKEVK